MMDEEVENEAGNRRGVVSIEVLKGDVRREETRKRASIC